MEQTQIKEIVIATTNKGKIKEFEEIFKASAQLNIKFKCIDEIIDEKFDVDETGVTYIENATLKAVAGAKATKMYTLGDDSGTEVDALDGRPGLYSARYLRSPEGGIEGILKELEELEQKKSPVDRSCRFVCSLVLADPEAKVVFKTEEYWNGKISLEAKGEQGFGFDPIVCPEEFPEKTVAEIGSDKKNQLSHRAKAIKKLTEFLA